MSNSAKIRNITEASDAIAQFEPRKVRLSDDTAVYIHRLSWLDFEKVYADIADAITQYVTFQALSAQAEVKSQAAQLAFVTVSDTEGGGVPEHTVKAALSDANNSLLQANESLEGLIARLASAPELAVKLVTLTARTGPTKDTPLVTDDVLGQWVFDDVLACALAAVQVNFIENQRVADFFASVTSALGKAAGS